MEKHDFAFIALMGAAFVTFARPYGRSLAAHLEGPRTDSERMRDARFNAWVARIFGAGLVGFGLWHLLAL